MKKVVLIIISVLFICTLLKHESMAAIEIMSDDDLSEIDGQFSTVTVESWEHENDTIRLFMDLHTEVYGTIESLRLGYYTRSSSTMRTNMAQVGMSGFENFYDLQYGTDGGGTGYYNDGANYNFAKITSDFNTMAPIGPATIEPWGNGGTDSSNAETLKASLTPNTNFTDWDIWMDNIRLGENPDKPMYINGQIIRVEFDQDYQNAGAKIQRIIIGTNDQQGNFYSNFQRYTGIVNPMLLAYTSGRSAGSVDPYEWTPGTMQMVRDSYIQCFGINIFNVEDRDTGFWLIMNLEGDHIGFELITGLPENAIDFSYTKGVWDIPLWDPDWTPLTPKLNNGNIVTADKNGLIYDHYEYAREGLRDPYGTKLQWQSAMEHVPPFSNPAPSP